MGLISLSFPLWNDPCRPVAPSTLIIAQLSTAPEHPRASKFNNVKIASLESDRNFEIDSRHSRCFFNRDTIAITSNYCNLNPSDTRHSSTSSTFCPSSWSQSSRSFVWPETPLPPLSLAEFPHHNSSKCTTTVSVLPSALLLAILFSHPSSPA